MPVLLIIALLLIPLRPVDAQTGGQFCLRAYEDRNGNGALDPGEPLLTRDVSAFLLNAEGVIVASAQLADSPNAAQGVICFQFLEAGQYSMMVSSALYTATTPDMMTAIIGDGAIPTVMEFGAQRVATEPTSAPAADGSAALDLDLQEVLPRVVISGLGSLLVMAGMVVLGGIVYLAFFNRRRPAPVYAPTTGSLPPVPADRTPTPGAMPAVTEDRTPTGEHKRV